MMCFPGKDYGIFGGASHKYRMENLDLDLGGDIFLKKDGL